MKNIATKIFVIIFLVMISIPLVFTLLKIKTKPVNANEKPISLNFTRNFPLKADLFKLYASVKTNVFETDPIPNRVINLDNGWKFLGNEFSNVLSESKGLVNSSIEELEALKVELLDRKNWCEANGIKYYLAIPPNKHTVYGEMIPIKKSTKPTKMQQLDSLCQTIGVNFINLGEKFPKDKPEQLYFKTDTHWNHNAGFYAYQSTMERIKRDFKDTNFIDFDRADLTEVVMEDVSIGDLNEMLMMKKDESFIKLKYNKPRRAVLMEKELQLPTAYHKDPATYETRLSSNTNDLKLLVFNDSYFGYFSDYLAENFGESVFIWDFRFDKKLILKEKPDVLFQEILERDTEFLLH